jgi:hypothetical protein
LEVSVHTQHRVQIGGYQCELATIFICGQLNMTLPKLLLSCNLAIDGAWKNKTYHTKYNAYSLKHGLITPSHYTFQL